MLCKYQKYREISTERKAISLPHKNIQIIPFYQEKIERSNSVLIRTNNKTSPKRNPPHLTSQQKRLGISERFNPEALHPHVNVQTLLKYRKLSNDQGKAKNIYFLRKAFGKKERIMRNTLKDNINFNKTNFASNLQQEIQKKFNQTRMILRQQNRIQKLQKIQRIYDERYSLKNYSRNSRSSYRETGSSIFCSPWNKNRAETSQGQFTQFSLKKVNENTL